MRIKLLKNDHPLGKKGADVEVSGPMARYLIRCGVAVSVTEDKNFKVNLETKDEKPPIKKRKPRKKK